MQNCSGFIYFIYLPSKCILNSININIIKHIKESIIFKIWDNKLKVYVKIESSVSTVLWLYVPLQTPPMRAPLEDEM